MAGLFDRFTNLDDTQNQGLLAAAAQMLQGAGDPRRQFGLGQALGTGISAYQDSTIEARRRKLQEEQMAQQKQLMGLQIQDKQSDFANQEAGRKRAAALQALHAQFGQGAQPQSSQQPDMSRMNGPTVANAEMLGQASAQQSQPSPAAANDLFAQKIGFAKQLRAAGYHPEADAEEEKALKFREEYSTTLQNLQGPDGKLRPYQVGKFGGVRDTGLSVAPKMTEMKLGDRSQWIDENTVAPGQQYQYGQSAESKASERTAAAGRAQSASQFKASFGLSKERLGIDRQEAAAKAAIGKAPTEFQGKSAAFGLRATEADKIISSLSAEAPTALGMVDNTRPGLIKGIAGSIPLIGGGLGAAVNALPEWAGAPNSKQQRAEQAQRDFINAVLRQESGAAIGESEFDNARKQYFAQPGDGAAVIDQKARNRKLAVQGLQSNAGRAAMTAPPAIPGPTPAGGGWGIKRMD